MPEVKAGAYLLDYLFRMGPVMGDGPLDMREVRSWALALSGRDEWEPWEAEMFVRLSREYCGMQHEATKRDCAPPWPPAVKMWQWVQNQRAEKSWDQQERRSARKQAKQEK